MHISRGATAKGRHFILLDGKRRYTNTKAFKVLLKRGIIPRLPTPPTNPVLRPAPVGYTMIRETANRFIVRANSAQGFARFMQQNAPPNSNARLFFHSTTLPGNPVIGSTKTFSTAGTADALLTALFEKLKAAKDKVTVTECVGETSDGTEVWMHFWREVGTHPELTGRSPYDLLSVFETRVNFVPVRGGCNKNNVHSINVNGLVLTSYPSRNDNCGLAVLRHYLGDDAFLKRVNDKEAAPLKMGNIFQTLRRRLNIKGAISAVQLKKVCEYLGVNALFIDPLKTDLIICKPADLAGYDLICVLHKGHWYHYQGCDHYIKCVCGRRYKQSEAANHKCSVERLQYYTREIRNKPLGLKTITFDIETRNDLANPKVYYRHDEKGKPYGQPKYSYYQQECLLAYWKGGGFSSEAFDRGEHDSQVLLGTDCVDQFLDYLGKESQAKRWYLVKSHNGARFDMYFILNRLMARDSNFNMGKQVLVKGTQILSISWGGHTFLDTMKHNNTSLSNLCSSYKVETAKLAEVDGLSTMDDICLYRPELGPEAYIQFLKSDPSRLRAYRLYCLVDCVSLYQVDEIYCNNLKGAFSSLGVDDRNIEKLLQCCTAPGMMFKLSKIMNSQHIITKRTPRATGNWWTPDNHDAFEFLKKCKIGGISHVQHAGWYRDTPLALIDVVSLYPTTFIFGEFPKGAPVQTDCEVPYKLGCYRVTDIKSPGLPIGCIPNRGRDGRLDWAADAIEETYITNFDIKTMRRLGYSFTVREGYYWKESWNPFKEMISAFKKIKQTQDTLKGTPEYNGALREVSKLCQNSFFGKLLETCKSYTFDTVKDTDLDSLEVCVGETLFLQQGKWIHKKAAEKDSSPIQFGVFVLAQSRELMQRYFDLIGRENIIASETDSIYCRKEHLAPLLASTDPELAVGKEYGQMEVEYDNLTNCFFLGKKCYYVETGKGCKTAFKGVPGKKLCLEVYQELFKKGTVKFEDIQLWERHLFNGNNRIGVSIGRTVKTVRRDPRMAYQTY